MRRAEGDWMLMFADAFGSVRAESDARTGILGYLLSSFKRDREKGHGYVIHSLVGSLKQGESQPHLGDGHYFGGDSLRGLADQDRCRRAHQP